MKCVECDSEIGKKVRDITIGVGVVILNDDHEILTLRRVGGWWCDQLMLPGGHIEEGEDIYSCAVRECSEETGLSVEPFSVNNCNIIFCTKEYINLSPYKHDFSLYVFAKVIGGTLDNREPSKHRDLQFMNISRLSIIVHAENSLLIPVDIIKRFLGNIRK